MTDTDVLIVGAGPAGLAAAQALTRAGTGAVILEQGAGPGASWRDLYDSLRLHTGKHLSALRGLSFKRSTPLFPSKQDFIDYLETYAETHQIPVRFGCQVQEAIHEKGLWALRTSQGTMTARRLVLAAGIISRPFTPSWEGCEKYKGTLIHSILYRNPSRWKDQRVLVVGTGNSGAEIAAELARAGIRTGVAVRSGAHVMPLRLLGLPIQYWSHAIERMPRPARELLARITARAGRLVRGRPVIPLPPWSPLDRPPIIGYGLPDAIRDGRVGLHPGILRFDDWSVTFTDGTEERFDAVIAATGFLAAIEFLRGRFATDRRGFPIANGVRCVDLPSCYVIGHRYAAVGALANIRRDAGLLAQVVRSGL